MLTPPRSPLKGPVSFVEKGLSPLKGPPSGSLAVMPRVPSLGSIDLYNNIDLHDLSPAGDEELTRRGVPGSRRWSALRGVMKASTLLRSGSAVSRRKALHQSSQRLETAGLAVVILGSGICSAVPFELLNRSDRGAKYSQT